MDEIKKAVQIFKQGGIVIFPTDTAFGIGCRIDDNHAVKRLFKIRKRPENKAVPVLFSNMNNSIFTQKLFIFLIAAVVLGGVTGYILSSKKGGSGNALTSGSVDVSKVSKGTIVGSNDTKTFKDTAVGILKAGGINGEGQFRLVRSGGDSQNVYLTSSSVDLSKFIGKKIKVWGETQKAQYAGWLMDAGRVEVL